MTDTDRITRVEQQILGLRQRNRKIFEILESQKVKPEEPEKRPSFEEFFKLRKR